METGTAINDYSSITKCEKCKKRSAISMLHIVGFCCLLLCADCLKDKFEEFLAFQMKYAER